MTVWFAAGTREPADEIRGGPTRTEDAVCFQPPGAVFPPAQDKSTSGTGGHLQKTAPGGSLFPVMSEVAVSSR